MRLVLLIFFLFITPAFSATTFYSPETNLREKDLELINSAKLSIEMAAYQLKDDHIIDALYAAHQRGVRLRILLDRGGKAIARKDFKNIALYVRLKKGGHIMHLKGYVIDGKIKRAGSANFTKYGLSKQDNDLTIDDDSLEVKRFKDKFEAMWSQSVPLLTLPPLHDSNETQASECRIKGSINKANEKLYYLPKDKGYKNVIITGEDERRYFCSEDEAKAAGWRAARP